MAPKIVKIRIFWYDKVARKGQIPSAKYGTRQQTLFPLHQAELNRYWYRNEGLNPKNSPEFGILDTNLPPRYESLQRFLQNLAWVRASYVRSHVANVTVIGLEMWAYCPLNRQNG